MGLFEEQISRKPDHYPWGKEFIDCMWEGFWTPNDFSFQSDLQDYKINLTDQERTIVQNTLSAIGQIEIAVKTFWAKLGDNLPHPSIKDLGIVMSNVEVIHNMAYEKLLTVLGLEHVFEENLKLDIIHGRVNYLRKYTHKFHSDNKRQYIYALILFTIFVENVSLFSQFYIINWFNRSRKVLKDTAHQVTYTSREEQCHFLVGVKLINTLREEYPELFDQELESRILHEAEEAFKAESKIIDWMVGNYESEIKTDELLSSAVLKEFIKNRINSSMQHIGFTKPFEINTDILDKTTWFDIQVLGDTQTDFFHQKSTAYVKHNGTFNEEDLF